MKSKKTGIRRYCHEERLRMADQLVEFWQKKFCDNLLGVAVGASVARGEDQAYSDLELDVFLREKPAEREEQYLQRVVDGMLIEAIYHTPEEYIKERETIPYHWHLSASDQWTVVYNPVFFDELKGKLSAIRYSDADFIRAATRKRYQLQESFCKVLNAVEVDNQEGISLLLMDAALNLLEVLAYLNQQPFTTFSRYISQAKEFPIKPDRLDDFLDLLINGTYQDLPMVREVCLTVFASLGKIFREYRIELFNDELDPNLLNRSTIIPE